MDTRAQEFLRQDKFRRNAVLIIGEMSEMRAEFPLVFLDEVIHSVFFLGKIHVPPILPERIFSHEILNNLQGDFPLPFESYGTKVPRRSPFSCVLSAVVYQTRQNNKADEERVVINRLHELTQQLMVNKAEDLVSSNICISQNKLIPKSVKYYGVSVSASGPAPRRIMVAASCLSRYWDSYVAGAVMTFVPKGVEREYFDGTMQLQELVKCKAFSLRDGRQMDPCKSCENMFGLQAETEEERRPWIYGNCAEAESLSRLFKKDKEVRQRAKPISETYTDERRREAEERLLTDLRTLLGNRRFNDWDGNFYIPKE